MVVTPPPRHHFVRSHGLGNDYLVADGATFGLELTPERVRRICHRHTGVGADGILEVCAPPPGFDAAIRIHNPDGSEAEKSGNGVRIFAKYCFDRGAPPEQALHIHTLGGPVEARIVRREATATWLRVSMGRVSFRCQDLPMVGGEGEHVGRPINVGSLTFTATCLSVGNPHCVLLDAPFDEQTLLAVGPLVERHALFPKRTNMQLARVVDRRTIEALIWERGAGRTESSGSSACAVAAACIRAGLTERDVTVVMPGGRLEVSISPDWQVEQVGPAQEVCVGVLSADLLAALA
jgi:diaminopimelate epimerase